MNGDQSTSLLQDIENSKVLDADQKRTLVNIFPQLNEEQKASLSAFFAKEKMEFSQIEEKYKAEKAPLYTEYLETLKQSFVKAEKTIATEAEKISTDKEQAGLEGLLTQI